MASRCESNAQKQTGNMAHLIVYCLLTTHSEALSTCMHVMLYSLMPLWLPPSISQDSCSGSMLARQHNDRKVWGPTGQAQTGLCSR